MINFTIISHRTNVNILQYPAPIHYVRCYNLPSSINTSSYELCTKDPSLSFSLLAFPSNPNTVRGASIRRMWNISKGFYSLKGSVIRFIRCKTTVPRMRPHAPRSVPFVATGSVRREGSRGEQRKGKILWDFVSLHLSEVLAGQHVRERFIRCRGSNRVRGKVKLRIS